MIEDDIRRIFREELARHDHRHAATPALHPTYYPSHYPVPAQPYYPGGPWPATCSPSRRADGQGWGPFTS